MERPAYNNFPKNRNGPGHGGQNQECRDASRRIICKLRGERYRNPSNEWLAKFIQEQLFTFDYEETFSRVIDANAASKSSAVAADTMSRASPSFSAATLTDCKPGTCEGVVGFQSTPTRVACGTASFKISRAFALSRRHRLATRQAEQPNGQNAALGTWQSASSAEKSIRSPADAMATLARGLFSGKPSPGCAQGRRIPTVMQENQAMNRFVSRGARWGLFGAALLFFGPAAHPNCKQCFRALCVNGAGG